MRRKLTNRLGEFFNGKGFYIVLILCVAAVGVSGYVLFFGGENDSLDVGGIPANIDYFMYEPSNIGDDEPLGAEASDAVITPVITDIPDYAQRTSEFVMAEDYLKQTAAEAEQQKGDKTPTAPLVGEAKAVSGSAKIPEAKEPAAEVVAPFFVWPVNGEVIGGFSVDELVFNSTTEDWRVHSGVDIAAAAGTHVGAIGDGVVEDVYEDELMGWSVVINHGDGLRSVSRGLMSDIPVAVGDRVRAGETIGGVGGSAELESAMPSHLHLELIGDGAQINPLETLP